LHAARKFILLTVKKAKKAFRAQKWNLDQNLKKKKKLGVKKVKISLQKRNLGSNKSKINIRTKKIKTSRRLKECTLKKFLSDSTGRFKKKSTSFL
jgi:predicted acetyltransferase